MAVAGARRRSLLLAALGFLRLPPRAPSFGCCIAGWTPGRESATSSWAWSGSATASRSGSTAMATARGSLRQRTDALAAVQMAAWVVVK